MNIENTQVLDFKIVDGNTSSKNQTTKTRII